MRVTIVKDDSGETVWTWKCDYKGKPYGQVLHGYKGDSIDVLYEKATEIFTKHKARLDAIEAEGKSKKTL